MKPQITAWSHSRWAAYSECPAKAKYKFIDKLQEPQGQALARGSEIHTKLEKYLRDGGRLPSEAKQLSAEYKALRKMRPSIELQLAFNKDWRPTGWFAGDAWCRVMIDVLVPPVLNGDQVVRIDDHKTGKVKAVGEYDTQLELYGLAGLLQYPTSERAESRLLFVDHGVTIPGGPYLRKDLDNMKKTWEIRTKKMLTDTVFKPTPGDACRWCHFKKGNNGPCKF